MAIREGRDSEAEAQAIHYVVVADELINGTMRTLIGDSDSPEGELERYMAGGSSRERAAFMWMNDNYTAIRGAIVAAGTLVGEAADILAMQLADFFAAP